MVSMVSMACLVMMDFLSKGGMHEEVFNVM